MYLITQNWCHAVSSDGCNQVYGSILRPLWWGKLGPKPRVILLPLSLFFFFPHVSMVFVWSLQPLQKKGWISSTPNIDYLVSRSMTCSFFQACFLPILIYCKPFRVYALCMSFIVPYLCNYITKVPFSPLQLPITICTFSYVQVLRHAAISSITKYAISQIVIVVVFSNFWVLII